MQKLALIIGFVFTFAMFANAQVHSQVSVRVPFDFYVQNQKLPAGDYLIESVWRESNSSPLVIRQKKGKVKMLFTANRLSFENDRKSFISTLTFNHYGGEYILAEIRNPSEELGLSIRVAKIERVLAKQFGKPTQETVLAQK